LDIRVALPRYEDSLNIGSDLGANDTWSNIIIDRPASGSLIFDYNGSAFASTPIFNGAMYPEGNVTESGVCIANQAYSWGFSSLLLLAFCVYTVLFAASLIVLQTQVYWLSRLDRSHQSYSIYADILTIAEALKSITEYNLLDLLQSPKALDEKLGGGKHGVRYDVHGLPVTRDTELSERWFGDGLLPSMEEGVMLQSMEPVREESELAAVTAEQRKINRVILID
jgi:hypothetical protein